MEQCTGKLNRKSLPRFNTGASERVRCSSLTLFSSHLTSLLVTRDAIQECAAPSLFGDTSRKGCRRGFSSFLNSSSCPAHYSCILSVDRGGCLHAHLQAPRCPPLPHLPPVDQTPPVPPLLLRAWLHPWFSSVANAGDRCSSAITIRDARSVIPVCRVAGRCLCI